MPPPVAVVLAGGAIGLLIGFFGVGGSSVATPVLSVMGVPALAAVASPLPATIPAAALAASIYLRSGDARPRAAAWSLMGAVPAAVAGGLVSDRVGGRWLLVASGVVLVAVGARILLPVDERARRAGERRRLNRPLLVLASAGVGFMTGVLANGGGFLLVPLYTLVFGLRMRQAVGTSLVVVAALAVPTLATHWALGHIDWRVAGYFALGAAPASPVGTRLALRVHGVTVQRAFGVMLIIAGVAFSLIRLITGTPSR